MKLIVVYTYCCTLHVQTCKINLQNIYKKKKRKNDRNRYTQFSYKLSSKKVVYKADI